jgi:N-acyl-L-homoserine lactone synthetase
MKYRANSFLHAVRNVCMEKSMLQLVTPHDYATCADALAEMHRLRFRVFKNRLDWDVTTSGDMERDSYDDLEPVYLLQRNTLGDLTGCVRLLPTAGPTMLRDTFAALLHGQPMPCDPSIWETSRFALDQREVSSVGAGGVATQTYELLVGLLEFGLANSIRQIVTVTDARMERILRRANWPLVRLGEPVVIGDTRALAGTVEISDEILRRLRNRAGFAVPLLKSPMLGQ